MRTLIKSPLSGERTTDFSLLRDRAEVARVAHNHKVAGSNPAPATMENASPRDWHFPWLPPEADFEPAILRSKSRKVRRSEKRKRKVLFVPF